MVLVGNKKYNQGLNRPDGVEREEHDFYATHPNAIIPLMKLLEWSDNAPKLVWENSCGQGHLSKMLEVYGHKVISTDLIDRGYGVPGVDFLKPNFYDTLPYDAIIMNPPYKYAQEFLEKSLNIAPTVCVFLRLTFLESAKRVEFFRRHPPKIVAVFSKRIPCSKNAEFGEKESSSVAYAWFIWQRDFKGEPVIKWI